MKISPLSFGGKTRSEGLLSWLSAITRQLIVPWIVVTLLLYIAVHSPLREVIASALGMGSRGCFFCTYSLTDTMVFEALSALWLLILAAAGAWVLAERFDGSTSEKVLVFGLLGLGFLVVPAALIGEVADWVGKNFLKPPAGPVLSAFPALVVVAAGLWQGWRPRKLHFSIEKPGGLSLLIAGLAMAMLLSSVAISLLHPPTGYDALGYHMPMSVFIWRDGNLGAYLSRAPGTWALAHPGTIELWIGLLRLVGGNSLANLGQIPFALLGAVAVYIYSRRLGLWPRAAQLAAAGFLLMPMVILQSGMQLNDLAGAGLLMAVIALVSAPFPSWKTDRLALIGLGLGLVAATKLVLLPGVFAAGLFALFGVAWRARHGLPVRRLWIWLAVLVVGFLVAVAPWWLRNTLRYGNPLFPAAIPFFGQGFNFSNFNKADLAFVPRRAAWLIYPLLETHDELSGLGTLFAMCVIPGFLMAAWRGRRQPLLLLSWVTVTMVVSWWFLSERFPRFLLAPAGLWYAFVPWALLAAKTSWRWLSRTGPILVAAAAIFSALVTFQQSLLPFMHQPVTDSTFYDQVWGIDPEVYSLPENEGLFWQTGYAPDLPEYAAYSPLLGPTSSRLVIPADREATTLSIVAKMRQYGLRYAYVTASPDFRAQIMALYNQDLFELVHQSNVVKGERTGSRRNIFRSADTTETDHAIIRYLFRLK